MLDVHMGMPKTGTSILQRCLSLKADQLGILYPEAFIERGFGQHLIATTLKDAGINSPVLSNFFEYLHANKTKRVIVSSESFSTQIGPNRIAGLIRFWKHCAVILPSRLIIVVRRMDRFVESMYLQQIRFGKYSGSIKEYIPMQEKWMKGFFQGLGILKRECGESLLIIPFIEDFDVLACFENLLTLRSGDLTSERSRLPSTAKYSAKAQSLLLSIREVGSEISISIDRRSLIRGLAKGKIRFSNDVVQYTIMGSSDSKRIQAKAVDAANNAGVTEYTDSFSEIEEMENFQITLCRSLLSEDDIKTVRDFCLTQKQNSMG